MRTNLNRYQVILEGKVIYRNKDREMAMVYFRSACFNNPYRNLRLFDTHTKTFIERP